MRRIAELGATDNTVDRHSVGYGDGITVRQCTSPLHTLAGRVVGRLRHGRHLGCRFHASGIQRGIGLVDPVAQEGIRRIATAGVAQHDGVLDTAARIHPTGGRALRLLAFQFRRVDSLVGGSQHLHGRQPRMADGGRVRDRHAIRQWFGDLDLVHNGHALPSRHHAGPGELLANGVIGGYAATLDLIADVLSVRRQRVGQRRVVSVEPASVGHHDRIGQCLTRSQVARGISRLLRGAEVRTTEHCHVFLPGNCVAVAVVDLGHIGDHLAIEGLGAYRHLEGNSDSLALRDGT